MAEWIKPMEWENEGVEPSDSLKKSGFQAKYKPPAGIFNYFLHNFQKCIEQLQDEADNKVEKVEGKGLSTEDFTTEEKQKLSKLDATADSEKNVNTATFASEAGVARAVQYALSVRFNGGSTEGTDLWTFDGNTSKSINITPAKIKAAKEIHAHTLDEITETTEKKFKRIVEATSTDGVSYTATVDGITELYNGLEITIIPDTRSTARAITLNINGLGAVAVRQPLSFTTFVATAPSREGFLYENTPCRLMYHANYAAGGIWLMADKQKTSAQDLYGVVPVENGGTGQNSIDYVPTQGSQKMVTSGGVYTAIDTLKLNLEAGAIIPKRTLKLDPDTIDLTAVFGVDYFCLTEHTKKMTLDEAMEALPDGTYVAKICTYDKADVGSMTVKAVLLTIDWSAYSNTVFLRFYGGDGLISLGYANDVVLGERIELVLFGGLADNDTYTKQTTITLHKIF